MQFIICCTLNHRGCESRMSSPCVFCTQDTESRAKRGQIVLLMGWNKGDFSSHCASFGADARGADYGNKTLYLQPRGCPSWVFLNNSKLQSDSRHNRLTESIKRPALGIIWSLAGARNKVAFYVERMRMLRHSDCVFILTIQLHRMQITLDFWDWFVYCK